MWRLVLLLGFGLTHFYLIWFGDILFAYALIGMMVHLFREVASLGGYEDVDPDLSARGLTALTEGLWLDMLVSPRNVSRREAQRVSMAYLAQVFPRHFQLEAERKAS